MKEETVKITWYLSIGYATANREEVYDTEMTAEEWGALGDDKQQEIMRDVIFQYIEWSYEVAE